jgi:TolB-like protein/DNA-binding winged helix-turn-helix (wHTH) protein/Tfp pilus assembly protein PilF
MTTASNSVKFIRFGVFELDLQSGELRKSGLRIKLQEQPFQVLAALLERPGEVVGKEELRKRLWADDTFVDFDHGLGSAINRLREALGDSADNPRFVETLSRRGYRFIAHVDVGSGLAAPVVAPKGHLRSGETAAPQGDLQALPPATWGGNGAPVGADASLGVGARKPARPSPWPLRLAAMLAMLLVGLAVGWFVWHRAWPPSAQAARSRISSLAVLPLENLSRDPEQEYFADGMTDELITNLAKVSALRVISRTSAMQYKDTKKPLPQIARELNVDAVVEGTVLRSGSRVRITAQLVHAAEDRHLWAETYERDLRDALALQGEVARDIANRIQVKLTPQERAGLSSARPVNPEAHEAYLRGVYFWNKRTQQDLEKSIEYFNQATQRDPGYALPYAGLANAYNSLGGYGHSIPREMYPKALAAALKALALDDTLGEAHAALGFYKAQYEWDHPGADREFQRAIELNPGYAFAHVWRADQVLSKLERHTEALAELDRARELDPTSLNVSDQRGWVLYMARRYDEAIGQFRKTLELEPRFAHAHCWLGKAYLQKGMLREGLAELQEAASLPGGDSPLFRPWLGYGYARCGKRAEASNIIETLKAQAYSSWGIAAIYCGLGQEDQALAWLERAYQERDPRLPYANIEPAFDPLRSDAHFKDLMRAQPCAAVNLRQRLPCTLVLHRRSTRNNPQSISLSEMECGRDEGGRDRRYAGRIAYGTSRPEGVS